MVSKVVSPNQRAVIILSSYRWIVLLSFFLSSAATGSVQGSLSTTKKIILNIEPEIDNDAINIAKYSDLLLFLPANFLSVYLIENYGLKSCISTGSILMFLGSLLRFLSISHNLWFWYFGHILCMVSGSFLKTPVTKLATNWFGDHERVLATAINTAATPIGLLFSQFMIIINFDNDDKYPQNRERAAERWQ